MADLKKATAQQSPKATTLNSAPKQSSKATTSKAAVEPGQSAGPKSIPERSALDPEFTWDLTDLYADDTAWAAEIPKIQALAQKQQAYRGKLGQDAANLLAYLQLEDELDTLLDPFVAYAMFRRDEDARDPVGLQLYTQATNLLTEIAEATAFATPEILAIGEAKIAEFLQAEPALQHYQLVLHRIQRQRAHTLAPSEEALLAAAQKLGQAPNRIFDLISDADLTFPDAIDQSGQPHPLTHGTFTTLLQSPDRQLRASAFQNLYGVYGGLRNTFAATLDAQMQQLQFFAQARHYNSSLEAALYGNEIPVAIYHNLIDTVHQHLPALHQYLALRRQRLGVEQLHYYDLYVPLMPEQDEQIDFAAAKELAMQALAPLGQDYLAVLEQGFTQRWLDVYENQGKRSGAYSSGVFGHHPYVLLNYTGTLDDAFTLVHEMGHALHSYLSDHHQPVTYAGYKIFVAEVASTCNEALLMQCLLRRAATPQRRAYLINHFLEQFRATLFRQTLFAEFELWCSEQVQQGKALTADALCQKYADLCRTYYGDAVEADPEIALEWARIPHFYYDFYVFQYATGFSAAIALSQRILQEGENAVQDYLGFLSGGCSQDPVSLLKGAGVDMSTPQPVTTALQQFGDLVAELGKLM